MSSPPADDAEEPTYYEDGHYSVAPGEGYTWETAFDAAGLAHENGDGGGAFEVCRPIRPGTYRVVY